ncbi:MAG: hypothetical protein ABIS47_07390 [Acidimicrobiales bacterium]
MTQTRRRRLCLIVPLALVALSGQVPPAGASHSWGGYHWARRANPFTLKLGDDVSSTWDTYLATASADWSRSTVLDTTVVAGTAKARTCRATTGRVEVCNAAYGSTGWLGLASISASGSHITAGTVKLNDTYFKTASYDTPAWRNLVMCQEVGHTLGLDHQDENQTNPPLGTCMDYSADPVPNQHPNQHDYDELATIYAHLDSTTTVGAATAAPSGAAVAVEEQWGRSVRTDGRGRPSVFVHDVDRDRSVVTFVIWA